ncbi:MAG: hypothetical protein GX458_18545, partial [Phyllobacteriaceae bacterium]|nr:hypothetical protein [Phyllobacteriaceae bacterium]
MATTYRTGLRKAPLLLLLGTLLAGCASSSDGFVEEGRNDDTLEHNAVKAVMQGLGAVDPSERPIEYKPRAPLVVPPNSNLPAPQAAGSADPRFPRNPEDVADEQRRAAMKGETGKDGRIMTPDELAKYSIPGAGKNTRYDPDQGRRLTPDELKGQGQSNEEAVKRAANP